MSSKESRQPRAERLAKRIVKEILDRGLAKSTFREQHPAAYDELLKVRADMEAEITSNLPQPNDEMAKLHVVADRLIREIERWKQEYPAVSQFAYVEGAARSLHQRCCSYGLSEVMDLLNKREVW